MFLIPFLPFALLGGLALWAFGSKSQAQQYATQPVVPPVQPPQAWPTYGGYNPYTYVPPSGQG